MVCLEVFNSADAAGSGLAHRIRFEYSFLTSNIYTHLQTFTKFLSTATGAL